MKYLRISIALLLLAALTVEGNPFKVWNWTEPTTYENAVPIDSADNLTYTLFCNDTPNVSGPPYDIAIALDDPGAPPSTEDMDPVVRGRAGTYYCVATASSSLHGTESVYSNESNFIVTSASLGLVPNPPTNLTLQ